MNGRRFPRGLLARQLSSALGFKKGEAMTDFDNLYEKFQFKENEAEKLRELHHFVNSFQDRKNKYNITTITSDGEKTTTISNNEVNDGKLV